MPGARHGKIHLIVEEVRPHGTGPALEAAGLLEKDRTEFIRALEKLAINTAARKLPYKTARSTITASDLELIYWLLLAVHRSGSYLRWGGEREFV